MSDDKSQLRSFFLVVEGLFEKSDSIGFDCVHQFRSIKWAFPDAIVRLFARKYEPGIYPDLEIEPIDRLYEWGQAADGATVVYHFCDGWDGFEDWLVGFQGEIVVRWHNNTPPWFFKHSRDYAERTIRGYEHIVQLSSCDRVRIWCNSEFSVRQLVSLNVEESRCAVVYPGSRYLEQSHHAIAPKAVDVEPGVVRLAFVGRVVPHKGHRHVLLAARALQKLTGARVEVHFAGRVAVEDYVEELRAMARDGGVAMHILDEVSEEELLTLYRSVRCLLYLSEHEGFGLPIYEAISVGVPVIAWLATAVEEIMRDHPLAVEGMDYDRIAARIMLLSDEATRLEVVDWQNRQILPCYNRARIEGQIRAACGEERAGVEPPRPCRPTFRDRIASAIDEILLNVRPGPPPRDVPKEIKDNFVTLHDLAAYRMLLDDEVGDRLAQGGDVGNGALLLPISRFSRRGGVRSNGSMAFDLRAASGHVVFGPFLKLPAGSFNVRFLIEVTDLPSHSGAMRFEAATVERCLAGVETYSDDFRDRWTPELQFSLEGTLDQVEFRIGVDGWPSGTLCFTGVEIRRIPSIEAIVETFNRTPDIRVEYRPKRQWAWLFQPGADVAEPTHPGSRYRDLGDAARDREQWVEALSHYKRHLRNYPSDVQILIQAGNCAKESTRYREAERFYDAALSILPTDVDINVQLGHLAKMRGRRADAASFFARALNLGRGAFDAERELRDIGVGR